MNYLPEAMIQNRAIGAKEAYVTRTIGENIDDRVASLEAEIARLKGVKQQLAGGASLLNVKIDDLRQAMNY